jgi:chromosome segregation protein
VQAAVEEARHNKVEWRSGSSNCAPSWSVRDEQDAAKAAVAEAAAARKEAEGHRNAAARRLAELGAAARSAKAEADRIAQNRFQAEQARDRDLSGLTDLEDRLRNAEAIPVHTDPSTQERDELAAAVPSARQHEIEVRLAVRTAESVGARRPGGALYRQAAEEREARDRAEARRAARARGALLAQVVVTGAAIAVNQAVRALTKAGELRDAVAVARAGRESELAAVRSTAKQLGTELERLTSKVHRDEVARAEQRMRVEQLEDRSAQGFGLDAETLLAEYGPHLFVPPTAPEVAAAEAEGRPAPEPVPYDRVSQERRASKAEKDLVLLGKVNPLALEEFAAMEERFKFLSDQLEDVKATRRDLLTVVKDVDDRILEVFASAFHDTAREFEQVFSVLFPGGEGRLILTDPDDMLTTGIEVEARPPGKKIKRLSLLSGGERSLTAVALLVAIFRARPSPFYIMDEVEAALDDVNLGRLLTLMEQLREKSQLIIITHQKRTMEIADALYGVTMRSGVTQVISQRLRDVGSVA